MVTTNQIVEAARKYLGIKYQNQGRSRDDGLDCGGLILVVARELGLTELEVLGYANSPDGAVFEQLLDEHLDRVKPKTKVQIGDILAVDYGDGIQHTMFVTETSPRLTVIHAKRPRGRSFGDSDRGVIEQYLHGYDERGWVRTYRVKGIENE